MAFESCKAPSSGRCKLCSVPWLPIVLGLVAIICIGIWCVSLAAMKLVAGQTAFAQDKRRVSTCIADNGSVTTEKWFSSTAISSPAVLCRSHHTTSA
jgi:hypothetical protein